MVMKDLLTCLCRYPYDPVSGPVLKEALGTVSDWNSAVDIINRHGITALAAYNISEAGLESMLPPDPLAFLRNGRRHSMARKTWLTEKWKEVNSILCAAGIRHVLIKGMALEYTFYGGRGLRQMNDNDILLEKEDALKAWHLLQEYGYKPGKLKSPLYRKIITDIGKHLPSLIKDGYSVEIHHRLFFGAERDLADENDTYEIRETEVDGIPAFVLQDDIHLDFLRSHLLMHMMTGSFQFRLLADMEIIKPGSAPEIPDSFILNPVQRPPLSQKKTFYRTLFRSVPKGSRLRYLAGDIFPSPGWIMQRHKCSAPASIFYYPRRLGKLFWLIGGFNHEL